MTITAKELLRRPITAEYEPPDLALSAHFFQPNRPLFTLWHVDAMLTDPTVRFALDNIRGPIISNAHFGVRAKNPMVKLFIENQIARFWRTSIQTALRVMDYGFLGCEVLYRLIDNQLQFDRLKFLHPHSTRVVTVNGDYRGMTVSNVGRTDQAIYISRPKCFWTVHARDSHNWYGRSRLRGAFLAWNEIWSDHGFRDQRRMWFYKNAYAGPKVGYPPGATASDIPGEEPIDHRILAQEIADKMVTGTAVTFPVVAPGSSGSNLGGWIIEDAKPIPIPEGLMEYGKVLKDEILEGMGVPPEVATAEGTGAFAGRRVPQQAFYSVLQEIMQDILTDFDEQILNVLVRMNYGAGENYEIECFGLLRTSPEEEQGGVEQAQGEETIEGQQEQPQQGMAMSFIQSPNKIGQTRALDHLGDRLMYYGSISRTS